jgi:hypothetical protein
MVRLSIEEAANSMLTTDTLLMDEVVHPLVFIAGPEEEDEEEWDELDEDDELGEDDLDDEEIEDWGDEEDEEE